MSAVFDHYFMYDELTSFLRDLVQKYPGLASLKSIGKSPAGRDLWLMEITNQDTGLAKDKSGFWVDGNTHAGEVTGSMLACYTISQMLTQYGKDPAITQLLDEKSLYVYPRLDVDGAELYLSSAYRSTGGARFYPYTEEEWMRFEGLAEEDVNADGYVALMRIRDPNGDWKVSEKDPRIMVKRRPEDTPGPFYRIYPEGMLMNYRGGEIKIAPDRYGLNLNRNFPAFFEPHPHTRGAGPFPLSEPETRAVIDFWKDHRNIGGMITYHTYSGIFVRLWDHLPDKWFEEHDLEGDLAVFKFIGEMGTKVTGYPCVSSYHGLTLPPRKEPRSGCTDTTTFWYFGAFGFCIELWDMPHHAGLPRFDERAFRFLVERTEDEELKLLKWNDDVLGGDGYIDWTTFHHPQLGQVDIGGWKFKFTWQNPPNRLLEEECRRVFPFTRQFMGLLPQIKLTEAKAEPIGEDVYRISVSVENAGFLPTNVSERGKKMVKATTVRIELEPEMDIAVGQKLIEIGNLAGNSDRIPGEPYYSGGGFRAKAEATRRLVEWVVRSLKPGRVKVIVESEKAGKAECDLQLGKSQ